MHAEVCCQNHVVNSIVIHLSIVICVVVFHFPLNISWKCRDLRVLVQLCAYCVLHIKKLNFSIIIMSNMACMSGLVVHSIICTLDWPRTVLRWSWWDDGDSLDFVVFRHQPRKITSGGDGDCLFVSGAGQRTIISISTEMISSTIKQSQKSYQCGYT